MKHYIQLHGEKAVVKCTKLMDYLKMQNMTQLLNFSTVKTSVVGKFQSDDRIITNIELVLNQ